MRQTASITPAEAGHAKQYRIKRSFTIAAIAFVFYLLTAATAPHYKLIALGIFVTIWSLLIWYISGPQKLNLTISEIYEQAKIGNIRAHYLERAFDMAGIALAGFLIYQIYRSY